jgi:hypothetical protein
MELSYTGRRVLAHLPVWAADEDAHVEAEGGPGVSVRAYPLLELTARLDEDPSTPDMDRDGVAVILAELATVGLCEEGTDGWRMTQAGYEALVDPTPPADQLPGSAFVDLNPGHPVSSAKGE